jgi:hypothetical protein
VTYIEELKDVIRKLHGVESTHRQSVPVKEVFQGKTTWKVIVEVFDLHGQFPFSRPTQLECFPALRRFDGPQRTERPHTADGSFA